MKRALIIYESLYGNTERVAHLIAEGIKNVSGAECVVKRVGEVHPDVLAEYDILLFGSPNHNQEPSRNLLKFLDRVAIVDLSDKCVAAFDTYTGGNKGIAVGKIEEYIRQHLKGVNVLTPGLSAKVAGPKGPLVDGEEERAREFGERLASEVTRG